MSRPPSAETATDLAQLPLEERIRLRARELYVVRGNESGSEIDDWLQAEDEARDAAEQAAKLK